MATAACLPIAADRAGPCVRDIFFEGLDLTGVEMALEARLNPETPGAPNIGLGMTVMANAEGIRLIGVTTTAGVPTSQIRLRINETTMKDAARFPYSGELGSSSPMVYDLIGIFSQDKRRLCYGEIVALPTVYGMDNAPANRSISYRTSAGEVDTWSAARVTFSDDRARIVIDGADLVGIQVGRALDAADRAEEIAGAVDIETTQGDWQVPVIGADQRMMSGYHPKAGQLDAAARRAGRAARDLAAIHALRLRDRPALLATAPKISIAAAPTLTDAVADVAYLTDARLTFAHARPMVRPGNPANTYMIGSWISYVDGSPGASIMSMRFITDAPVFELFMGDLDGGSNLAIEVDGCPIARDRVVSLNNSGAARYVRVDFGDDVPTLRPQVAIAAGGAGYVPGDVVTVQGGTGDPLRLVVTQVDGGAITNWYVQSRGAYTALPAAGAATTTSGAGTGATVNLTDTLSGGFASRGHSTRRARRVEVIGSGAKFGGVRIPKYGILRPWPVAGPRLIVMQDSFNDTFAEYAGGAWSFQAGRLLGIEDIWINGVGGQGMVQEGGNNLNYPHRLKNIADNLPADRPVIHLVQGSINDRNQGGADNLKATTQAYWERAFAMMPDAFHIQTGILIGPSDGSEDTYNPLLRAGFRAAQAIYDPTGRRSAWIETQGLMPVLTGSGKAGAPANNGNTDYWLAGDGAHPHQPGHDFLSDTLAPAILAALQGMH